MPPRLQESRYGKARIQLVKVEREGEVHRLHQLTVRVLCEGALEDSYTRADNRDVLPTDTMKNTVYALAHGRDLGSIEDFGTRLAKHFLDGNPAMSRVVVDLVERPWARVETPAGPHPHAFVRAGAGRGTAAVTAERSGLRIRSGVENLVLLKTTESGFEGFRKDAFTTLPETRDRILATRMRAEWSWARPPGDYPGRNRQILLRMIQAFSERYSPSVQRTLYEMGEAALDSAPEIEEVRLVMPNLHCHAVDLRPFGMENRNVVFVATREPHGHIEAVVRRG
jgi:urate oxidase